MVWRFERLWGLGRDSESTHRPLVLAKPYGDNQEHPPSHASALLPSLPIPAAVSICWCGLCSVFAADFIYYDLLSAGSSTHTPFLFSLASEAELFFCAGLELFFPLPCTVLLPRHQWSPSAPSTWLLFRAKKHFLMLLISL